MTATNPRALFGQQVQGIGFLDDTHSEMHGRSLRMGENVLAYGADRTGVADSDEAIIAAQAEAISNGTNVVIYPAGTYNIATGSSITLSSSVKHMGAGRNKSIITFKNAYGFVTPSSGAVTNVTMEDLWIKARDTSTSGGALKAYGDSFHAAWTLNRIDADGTTASADPIMWFDGWIGSHLIDVRVQTGQIGFLFSATAFATNANSIVLGRVASTTVAAVKLLDNPSNLRFRDLIIESNEGYGFLGSDDGLVSAAGGNWVTMDSVWFEDNRKDNIRVEDGIGYCVTRNKFQSGDAGDATQRHVRFVRSASGGRDYHVVEHNTFQDASTSGVAIDVGADVEDVLIQQNRGAGTFGAGGTITDNGTRTVILNASGSAATDVDLKMWPQSIPIQQTAARLYAGAGSPEGVITAAVGSGYHRTDGAAGTTIYTKVTGAGNTGWRPVSVGGSTAYSTTNVSADRSYDANATTTDELADVLGTLIADLKANGVIT